MVIINTSQGMVSVGDPKCHLKLSPPPHPPPCEDTIQKKAGGAVHRTDSIMTDTELAYTRARPMQRKDQDALSNQEWLQSQRLVIRLDTDVSIAKGKMLITHNKIIFVRAEANIC